MALGKLASEASTSKRDPQRAFGLDAPEQAHLRPESDSTVPLQVGQGHSPGQSPTGQNARRRTHRRWAYATQSNNTLPYDAIYFMVDNNSIFPWRVGLQQSLIPCTNLCDESFYITMRREYWIHRGWWRQWLSLYTFVGCDFYQVSHSQWTLYGQRESSTSRYCTNYYRGDMLNI